MAVAVRGRVVWLPPLLLFAAVLLLGSLAFAIANLDRGAEMLPEIPAIGTDDPRPAPFGPTGDQLQVVWQITIASIFLVAIAAVVFAKLRGDKLDLSPLEFLGYAFGIGIVGLAILLWPSVADLFGSLSRAGGPSQPPPSPGSDTGLGQLPTSAAFPAAVALFLVVLVAVWLYAFSSKVLPDLLTGRVRAPDRERRRLEAASAVRRTLLDIEAGGDFRTAVLACYQRMCSLFATRGVARQEALTPREIEGLALSELGLSQAVVDDLTGLFEEARYSEHEIGPAQRDRAVECLGAIRRELEG